MAGARKGSTDRFITQTTMRIESHTRSRRRDRRDSGVVSSRVQMTASNANSTRPTMTHSNGGCCSSRGHQRDKLMAIISRNGAT